VSLIYGFAKLALTRNTWCSVCVCSRRPGENPQRNENMALGKVITRLVSNVFSCEKRPKAGKFVSRPPAFLCHMCLTLFSRQSMSLIFSRQGVSVMKLFGNNGRLFYVRQNLFSTGAKIFGNSLLNCEKSASQNLFLGYILMSPKIFSFRTQVSNFYLLMLALVTKCTSGAKINLIT
jgi:hypothetical protein